MTVEVGVDGFETERFYENLDLRMERCSKEEAEDIEPIAVKGAPGHTTSFGGVAKGTDVESTSRSSSGARGRSVSS